MTIATKNAQPVSTPVKSKRAKRRTRPTPPDTPSEMDASDDAWDREIERDAAAGKLDQLAEDALREHRAGKTKPVPECNTRSIAILENATPRCLPKFNQKQRKITAF